jgi:predicted dehydrogenase
MINKHNIKLMKEHKIGIIMNGVSGRMGTNQHLLRSIVAIIKQGGVRLSSGDTILPDPVLVGRNEARLSALGELSGIKKISTDLDSILADNNNSIYFDSQSTGLRAAAITKAIKAGKHIYCEKPMAANTREAMELVPIV